MTKRFHLLKKFWTVRATYVIQDSDGADAYHVHANLLGSKLTIEDAARAPLGELQWVDENFVDSLMNPTYRFVRDGNLVATVQRTRWFHSEVQVEGGEPLTVERQGVEYTISRGGKAIATASAHARLVDIMTIDVIADEDPLLAIVVALALDLIDFRGK